MISSTYPLGFGGAYEPKNSTTPSEIFLRRSSVSRPELCLDFTASSLRTIPVTDTAPPSVTIASPSSGATVSRTIDVVATASDDVGVAGVQFRLDDADLGAEDTEAPYSVPWDTTTTSDGSHTLTAVARDAAGNVTIPEPVTVTVSNTSPPPPSDTFAAGDSLLS